MLIRVSSLERVLLDELVSKPDNSFKFNQPVNESTLFD